MRRGVASVWVALAVLPLWAALCLSAAQGPAFPSRPCDSTLCRHHHFRVERLVVLVLWRHANWTSPVSMPPLSATSMRCWRCVLFVSFAVRCGSISPTFSTFLEAVHAGLVIVKLLWRLQLITLLPNREPQLLIGSL